MSTFDFPHDEKQQANSSSHTSRITASYLFEKLSMENLFMFHSRETSPSSQPSDCKHKQSFFPFSVRCVFFSHFFRMSIMKAILSCFTVSEQKGMGRLCAFICKKKANYSGKGKLWCEFIALFFMRMKTFPAVKSNVWKKTQNFCYSTQQQKFGGSLTKEKAKLSES